MKLSIQKIFENKKENLIVLLSMVAVVILTFAIFGWTSIKTFMTTPLIWKGHDTLEVHFLGAVQKYVDSDNYEIYLGIDNQTDKEIDWYEIIFYIEGLEFECNSLYQEDLSANSIIEYTIPIKVSEIPNEVFQKLEDTEQWDYVDVDYKIKTLESDGEIVVNNTGLWKDLFIIIVSLGIGIVGFLGDVKEKWLRIILKMCALPTIIIIVAALLLILFFASASIAEEDKKKKLEEAKFKYAEAEKMKDICLAKGDMHGVAQAQAEMSKQLQYILSFK